MHIRTYGTGEEPELYRIFYTSIHENAADYYTQEQLNAWAPERADEEAWKNRIQGINPFVIEDNGQLLAYGDIQPNGYIDHFFVRGRCSGNGLGQMLLDKLLQTAAENGIKEITADVSLAAERFFSKNGFEIIKRKSVNVRGIDLKNALMKKTLPL